LPILLLVDCQKCEFVWILSYVCILSHIVISLPHSWFPSLCGLSVFKTLYSVFNTCHLIQIFKTLHVSLTKKLWVTIRDYHGNHNSWLLIHLTTCFGLNRPSSCVKKLFIKKIAVILGIHAPSCPSDRGTKGHECLESQQFS
jgi:hypothetical protein